jgi:protein SCO1/2
LLFAVAVWALSIVPAFAQRAEPAPKELEEVGVTEHRGDQTPLDLPFVESDGRDVRFGDFFDGKRPVILTLNYSNCPMLCSLQLTGLFQGLEGMQWDLGENFQMVTVSIDPKESPERAQLTKQKYLKMYGRPGVAAGWHCLVGDEENIRKLADTVGFGYTFVQDTGEYAHAAVTMILTPNGVVSRYLYGVEYDPQTIRLSLVEAAEGKIGSAMDQILLFCFHYDETKGRYGPAAAAVMRIGGTLTLLGLGVVVLVFWRRGAARDARQEPEASESTENAETKSSG